MELEELRQFRNQARPYNNSDKAKGKERNNSSHFPKQREARTPKFSQYTPLNEDMGRILEEALSVELIPTLKRVPTPRNTDMSKHCHYHKNYGHSINECVVLRDKIEELIQVRHLRRFI